MAKKKKAPCANAAVLKNRNRLRSSILTDGTANKSFITSKIRASKQIRSKKKIQVKRTRRTPLLTQAYGNVMNVNLNASSEGSLVRNVTFLDGDRNNKGKICDVSTFSFIEQHRILKATSASSAPIISSTENSERNDPRFNSNEIETVCNEMEWDENMDLPDLDVPTCTTRRKVNAICPNLNISLINDSSVPQVADSADDSVIILDAVGLKTPKSKRRDVLARTSHPTFSSDSDILVINETVDLTRDNSKVYLDERDVICLSSPKAPVLLERTENLLNKIRSRSIKQPDSRNPIQSGSTASTSSELVVVGEVIINASNKGSTSTLGVGINPLRRSESPVKCINVVKNRAPIHVTSPIRKNRKRLRRCKPQHSNVRLPVQPLATAFIPNRLSYQNYSAGVPMPLRMLRPIVVDGSNVAMCHGKNRLFSCLGIELCIKYFRSQGHSEITVFVPHFRLCKSRDVIRQDILEEYAKSQTVVFTPSRRVNGKLINSYDDRFILDLAANNGGIIVSNDNYRDLKDEKPQWREAVDRRLLMFLFVGDRFMVPDDPLGRAGVTLKQFLSFPS